MEDVEEAGADIDEPYAAWREGIGWKASNSLARHEIASRATPRATSSSRSCTFGDGFFAAFDGPIRAIRYATTIGRSVLDLGLEVGDGLHTCECETVGEKLSGLAVNLGARVTAQAQPGEVLMTSTVTDLVRHSD